ncbi:MAG: hypothetical protein V3S41_09365 [Spirochaetia bacterium]
MIHLLLFWLLLRVVWTDSDNPVGRKPASGRDRGRSSRAPVETSEEVRIYRLAGRLGGVLTVSDVVVEIGCSVAAAEALLQHITDGVRVRMEVLDDGRVRYEFPELFDGYFHTEEES